MGIIQLIFVTNFVVPDFTKLSTLDNLFLKISQNREYRRGFRAFLFSCVLVFQLEIYLQQLYFFSGLRYISYEKSVKTFVIKTSLCSLHPICGSFSSHTEVRLSVKDVLSKIYSLTILAKMWFSTFSKSQSCQCNLFIL